MNNKRKQSIYIETSGVVINLLSIIIDWYYRKNVHADKNIKFEEIVIEIYKYNVSVTFLSSHIFRQFF
jgi:hypothetical protein